MRLIGIFDKLDLCASFFLSFGGGSKAGESGCVGSVLADIGKDLGRVSVRPSVSLVCVVPF